MLIKKVVQKALKETWESDYNPGSPPDESAPCHSSVTSQMIYDIYGGEILKTHKNKGWHFYNRINGERIDFTSILMDKLTRNYQFEDIPSTPDETYNYFDKADYSNLFLRFIRTFEEIIGLDKRQYRVSV